MHTLCLAKLKELWDLEISRHYAFKEIAKKRYLSNGGRLDRRECVPYDQYVKMLGKVFTLLNLPFSTSAGMNELAWGMSPSSQQWHFFCKPPLFATPKTQMFHS